MVQTAPSEMATRDFSDSDKYITKSGAFLRRTSLDEILQLINIIKGDMSIVGYRPVCLTEVSLNEMRSKLGVFSLRPGITGLAQVMGRDNVPFEEKANLDRTYVERCSLKTDIWCCLQTVKIVINGEGVK